MQKNLKRIPGCLKQYFFLFLCCSEENSKLEPTKDLPQEQDIRKITKMFSKSPNPWALFSHGSVVYALKKDETDQEKLKAEVQYK